VNKSFSTFIFIFLFGALKAVSAPLCSDLIKQNLNPAPETPNQIVSTDRINERVLINRMLLSEKSTLLKFESKPLSPDHKIATMDLLQMMVHTTSFTLNDKNVLYKDELILGVPLSNGFSLQATYFADGRAKPSFALNSVELVTLTGETHRIVKSMLERDSHVISKKTVELNSDIYPAGYEITAALPVQIEGEALIQLKKITPDLELFDKTEIKKIAEEKTFSQMKRSFLARKTRSLFKKYFVAAPFKSVANFLPTIFLASTISWSITNINRDAQVLKPSAAWVQTGINEAAAKSISPEVKILFHELKAEAQAQINSGQAENPMLGAASLSADKYKFSDRHMTWVFEQADAQGQKQTYIVLTDEVAGVAHEPIKYLIIKVDATKYKILIDHIKSQGHILAKK
jgi:hypothetical protein